MPREEVFVTTKLRSAQHGYGEALAGFEESRTRLGLDYVDTWRAFADLRERGLVRSIGVSNFTPDQIERLVAATGVARRHGIVTESWRP